MSDFTPYSLSQTNVNNYSNEEEPLDQSKKQEISQTLDDEINEMRAKYFLKQPNDVKPISRKESNANKSYTSYQAQNNNDDILSDFHSSQKIINSKPLSSKHSLDKDAMHKMPVVNHDLDYNSDDNPIEIRSSQSEPTQSGNLFSSFGRPIDKERSNTNYHFPSHIDYLAYSEGRKKETRYHEQEPEPEPEPEDENEYDDNNEYNDPRYIEHTQNRASNNYFSSNPNIKITSEKSYNYNDVSTPVGYLDKENQEVLINE